MRVPYDQNVKNKNLRMKKRLYNIPIVLLLVLLYSVGGRAQTAESWTLNTTQTGTKEYIARESITLKSGFSYTSSPGNTFTAKIDHTLLFPPTTNTYAKPDGTITSDPASGSIVGNIPGQFDVSAMGAATHTVPIDLPSGINGMQPSVALVYNSQLAYGLGGKGFDLAATSFITRVPHNLYYETVAHGVSFDGNDRFALDGMRLICDNIADNGKNGTVYFTENNQTTRIISYETLGDGPKRFVVETPDGKKMEYGTNDNSRLIPAAETGAYRWYLEKVTDNNGNTIEYTYSIVFGQFVLSAIHYSGGSVEFAYVQGEGNSYYIHGNEIKNSARLIRISTKGKGTNEDLKQYVLKPDNDAGSAEIEVYANNEKLEPIRFNFSTEAVSGNNFTYQMLPYMETPPDILDFNSDGYDDMVFVGKKGDSYVQEIFLNNADEMQSFHSQELDMQSEEKFTSTLIKNFADIDGDGKNDYLYQVKRLSSFFMVKEKVKVRVNGKEVEMEVDVIKDIYSYELRIRTIDKSFGTFTIYTDTTATFSNKSYGVVTGDFDGDGKAEIVVIKDKCYSGLFIKYENGQFISSPLSFPFLGGIQVYQGDFDGDGKVDVGFKDLNRFAAYRAIKNGAEYALQEIYSITDGFFYDHLSVADLNQDGVTDLFAASIEGVVLDPIDYDILDDAICYKAFFRNKNNSFDIVSGTLVTSDKLVTHFPYFIPDSWGYDIDYSNEDIVLKDLRIDDLDGDGFLDIVVLFDRKYRIQSLGSTFNNESKTILCDFFNNPNLLNGNNNTGFINATFSGNIALGSFVNNQVKMQPINYGKETSYLEKCFGASYSTDYKYLTIAHFGGTGRKSLYRSGHYKDILEKEHFSINQYEHDMYRFLLGEIKDSYGNSLSIQYIPQKSETNLSPMVTPYFRYTTGMPLVQFVSESNSDLNYSRTSSFGFGSLVLHPFKGVLGYLGSTITNADGIINYTLNGFEPDFACIIPSSTYSRLYEGVDINRTKTTFELTNKGNKRYSMQVKEITERNGLNGTMSIKTFNTYDAYNNPTKITTQLGSGNSALSSVEEIAYIQKGGWYPNKPSFRQITQKTVGQDDIVRKEHFFYNDTGNMLQHTKDSTDVNQVQTFYTEYNGGNPGKVTVKAKDGDGNPGSRSQTFTYTRSGRFVETEKDDQFNETIMYHYDESKGLLMSKVDRMGTTSYQYDGFGRLTQTTYPDGIKTVNVLQWAGTTPGKPVNAKFYSYSETSGQAPVWVWYDALGREVRKDSYGLNNKKIMVDTEYNAKGQVYRVSEPYFENTGKTWAATYAYDNYGRISNVATPMGTNTYAHGSTTTVTSPAGTKKTTINSAGLVIEEETNQKKVNFTYYANGLLKTATPEGGTGSSLTVGMEYDLQGHRTKLTDPSAGVITSNYDGWGQLVWEKQAVHNASLITTNYHYHPSGLLNYKQRNGETTNYAYDNLYRLQQVSIANKHSQSYRYGPMDRITQVTEVVENNKTFVTGTEYDIYGRIKKEIHPTGYYTINEYDKYSFLTSVKDRSGRLIWQALEESAKGQITLEKKGAEEIQRWYDYRGFSTGLYGGQIDMSWNFNNKGNLSNRVDNYVKDQEESYIYDVQNRLTNWNVYDYSGNLTKQSNIVYNTTTGTISQKSDLSNFTFNYGENGKSPHALTSISGVPTQMPADGLSITYTDFKKVSTLAQGNKTYALMYGIDEQRRKSVYKVNNAIQETRYYLGNYEEVTNAAGITKKIHYLSGGTIFITTGNTETLYYGYYDHLGSLMALANEQGQVVERYAYDPWGNRRNPNDWSQPDTRTSWIINRGFTMHEHLDAFGIINMNGRVYDPLTSMFLSPDPQLQSPGDWLNYNRYGYCMNNPMIYADPTGEFWWLIPVAIGAYLGGSSVNHSFNPFKWDYKNWQTYAGIGIGGLAGWAGAGIGGNIVSSAIAGSSSSISASIVGGAIGGMLSGGISGAGMTALMGGNFSDIMNSMIKGSVMGGFGGGISGGVGAAIGDFSGVAGGALKNGMYELGHSALKGAAVGLSSGAMMAAMEQDASYMWKGALTGAALSTGMAGLRIGLMGSINLPPGARERFADDDAAFGIKNSYPRYRRGGLLKFFTPAITLGRDMMVNIKYLNSKDPREVQWYHGTLAHERSHVFQQKVIGGFNFYKRTLYEYIIDPGYSGNKTYYDDRCLDYWADQYEYLTP